MSFGFTMGLEIEILETWKTKEKDTTTYGTLEESV